jgi:hypothetical protein
MDNQASARLLDPVSTNNQTSVFVIPVEATTTFLRPDLKLHYGMTTTAVGTDGCVWRRGLGLYAGIDSIMVQDQSGRQLQYIRSADRWAHWLLTRHQPSAAHDLDPEYACVQRNISLPYAGALADIAAGRFQSNNAQFSVSASASTTAQGTVDLSMLCNFFSAMIPLSRTGRLTITIAWQQSAARMFSQAIDNTANTAHTNPVVVNPQISYTVFQSAQLFNSLPSEIAWAYNTPELSQQPYNATADRQTIQVGLHNMRLSALIWHGSLNTITYPHAVSLDPLVNFVINGRNWWPSDQGSASLISETVAAAGDLTLHPGSHHRLMEVVAGTSLSGLDTVLHGANAVSMAAHTAVDLRTQLKTATASFTNCTQTDNTGIVMNLTTASAAGQLYFFGIRERTAIIGANGITQLL